MKHQFKIGDRVRVIASRPADWSENPIWTSSMDGCAGKEGVVNQVGNYVRVRFEDGNCWDYKPSWLLPIPAKKEALLKVGDCVRVLDSKPLQPAGTILPIDQVDSDDPNLLYRVGRWWYRKDQVELVGSNTVESARISIPHIDAIKSLFGAGNPKEPTTKLPLISKTKLLTTIKLD